MLLLFIYLTKNKSLCFSCRPVAGSQQQGGPKTRKRDQKPKGGAHFKNTVLDVCSNRGVKREMGGHRFQMGGWAPLAPLWRRPCTLAHISDEKCVSMLLLLI